MKLSRLALLASAAIAVAAISVYVWNPFSVPSWDPRARVLGVIPYRVPSASMSPTLSAGDFVLACTVSRSDVRVGDIVVFLGPPELEVAYLKRVLALGGDTVEFADSDFLLNGVRVREPYLQPGQTYDASGALRVPTGTVFVAGDNRDHSVDSRHFGPIALTSIIGRVCARI